MPAGLNPQSVDEVNHRAGEDLREFILLRARLIRDQDWLATINLQEVYGFTADDEAALKAAFQDIWGVIQPMDMSRISKMAGFSF